MRPPGLLSDIIDFTLRTSLYPQPELALAGAISLLATITGRKLADKLDTGTNAYVIGIDFLVFRLNQESIMPRTVNPDVRERWLARMRRFRQSDGLTIVDFCRSEGVSVPSFYQWKKKLVATSGKATESSVRFAQVVVTGTDRPSVVTLRLPGGTCIELSDSLGHEQLTKVLSACLEATRTDTNRETAR